ncbi:MAG: DUF2237 domain-containing protein [Lysobacterales bacterium]
MDAKLNVLGEVLASCSEDPLTGYYRDGCCNTEPADMGSHTICCRVTEEFLQYSLSVGNDLTTPRAEFGFPGLRPGDQWCLCAARWQQALDAGVAPKVVLQATHAACLRIVKLADLKRHAMDLV